MSHEPALALLHIASPTEGEQTIAITHSPFNIGRAPANDVQLAHQLVSRHHARLLFLAGEMVLLDLNSANGTMVGQQRLAPSEPHALSYGEPFHIGPYTLQLEAAPAVSARQVPEVAPEAAAPGEQPFRLPVEPAPEASEEAGRPRHVTPPPSAPPPAPAAGESQPYDATFGLPGDASRYLQYLPPIYHDDPFLRRFLLAFEGLLAPVEQTVDSFDLYLDPRTAPAFFLEQLAAWLGLTLDEKWPEEKRRAVMAEAAELYRLQGTRAGLIRHLEICTGLTAEIVEPEDRPFHFQVVLRVPAGQAIDQAAVERIIQNNKPAHTTHALEIVPERQARN
jgi:phage tail-like protein